MWDNTWFGHIFLPSSLLPGKHYVSALWHSHLIKKKMINCKRDHIFDCVTGWRNRLMFDSFKKTWKSNRAPGNRVTFCQKERERVREVELWDVFPNEKNKGRGVPCPEFSFLDFRRRENESEHAVGVTVLQRLRAPSLFSSVNERKGRSFRPLITQSSRGLRVKCSVDITHSFLQRVRPLTSRFC